MVKAKNPIQGGIVSKSFEATYSFKAKAGSEVEAEIDMPRIKI